MEHGGVYLESSIVDLKPRVLDFLGMLVAKAKELQDVAVSFKKKELADMVGKDTRTVSRYLQALEEKEIIQTKGVRGRSKGTVILLNTKLVKFETSDKALINSDEPISIDDIVDKKMPKKEKPPKKTTRKRRTKKQVLESRFLKEKEQNKYDAMNSKLVDLQGVPNWEWFQETDNPVGNYRTYLISRLYNRYAALFTDKHNAEVKVYREGTQVPAVSNDYDCLPEAFYGSPKWNQFEKFRLFCEENDIDPAVYLSAQFGRSLFTSGNNGSKKFLPFVNALMSDASYDVYNDYCNFQKKVSRAYAAYKHIPIQFPDDFAVRALVDGYKTADSGVGLLQYRHAVDDFLCGDYSSDEEYHLANFYRLSEDTMIEEGVSLKTREIIKKFILTQSMILTGGVTRLPAHMILSSEHTEVVVASARSQVPFVDEKTNSERLAYAQSLMLGMLTHPTLPTEDQVEKGREYMYQRNTLDETRLVMRLILDRKGLLVSLSDIQQAFKEYGKERIPLDDLSILDVGQIIRFMEGLEAKEVPEEQIDLAAITQKKTYKLEGHVEYENTLDDFFDGEFED
ncbi:putative transcriptional regulator [Bacillus phage SDFMU_Pbc]|uniref:Transcriptional regulator n=1 Tax=Bacillus phage SDFMU_Pbc TaxID=3076135 RepID=A0AA96KRD7_9CAUD|nr:putative transcriptional regulator [Bacillus phage SDFMU_Pbc]